MAQEHINTASEEIKKLDQPQATPPSELAFTYLLKPENKTTKLLANSGSSSPIHGKSIEYPYDFSEPIFLMNFEVTTKGYSRLNDFLFLWKTIDGRSHSHKVEIGEEGGYSAPINDVVTWIAFKPPQRLFSNTSLEEVRIVGFPFSDVGKHLSALTNIQSTKKRVQELCRTSIDAAQEKQNTLDQLGSGLITSK